MTMEFWITTAAIVIGPLAAVLITHWLQRRADERQRKLFVFRALMTTRKTPLSAERVQALNLVEIEFSRNKLVMQKFRRLLETYNDHVRWRSDDEAIRRAVIQEVDDRTAELLGEMGAVLGYKMEDLDLLRGGYSPEAFSILEQQQREIREFFVGLNNGTRRLPTELTDVRRPEELLEDARRAQLLISAAENAEKTTND